MSRFGNGPDSSTRDYAPHLISFSSPYDHDARVALERWADLELPILCIGPANSQALAAHVSHTITVEDLRTVLDLVAQASGANYLHGTECRAEDLGQCRGRVTDLLVQLLEHLLSLRLPDYPDRGQKVFEASLWIGSHLCLPPVELMDLVRAAHLREIGKLGLPDRILFTPRHQRTPVDQAAYDHYPELGARVLKELPQLKAAAIIVEHQLENFDGTGPHSLQAHQIPLGSRVLRVAATFATIISNEDRARSAQQVIEILEEGRGKLYDPLLVKLVANFHAVSKPEAIMKPMHMVRVSDLGEDMILGEDVWSRTGMKIIPAHTRITPHILGLLRQFPLDPALESLQVYR
jgi:response regulator RpfG family c-di-GMP phosphodiesterase